MNTNDPLDIDVETADRDELRRAMQRLAAVASEATIELNKLTNAVMYARDRMANVIEVIANLEDAPAAPVDAGALATQLRSAVGLPKRDALRLAVRNGGE